MANINELYPVKKRNLKRKGLVLIRNKTIIPMISTVQMQAIRDGNNILVSFKVIQYLNDH